ncbi:MAG TPA: glycerophosphodiester phosphodiesterase [Clostridiales bacterium]|nr:glycerophosphodiester phosphodiesterase [Clostridiales bacterium]
MKKPIIIAHRGASAYAPENTLSSFQKALEMKAGGIEIDVHLTKDGYPVVVHDEKLGRTCNGTGFIKEKTLEELKELDFGSWFSPEFANEKIPTLKETMDLIADKNILFNIEIKNGPIFYPGIEKVVVDMVRMYNMSENVIVSSFNHYSLAEVKNIAPEIKIGLLYSAGLYNPWEYAKMVGAEAIHPFYMSIHPEAVKMCNDNGILVNPYTINNPEHMQLALLAGVDGIITNYPDIALNIVEGVG